MCESKVDSFNCTFCAIDFGSRCLSDNINGRVQEIMGMKFESQAGQFEFYWTQMSL